MTETQAKWALWLGGALVGAGTVGAVATALALQRENEARVELRGAALEAKRAVDSYRVAPDAGFAALSSAARQLGRAEAKLSGPKFHAEAVARELEVAAQDVANARAELRRSFAPSNASPGVPVHAATPAVPRPINGIRADPQDQVRREAANAVNGLWSGKSPTVVYL